ncbi:aminopeptidase [Pseudoalteromonas sp. S2721]|uniref:DUF4910 domain-containing protein n=1 Tax=Pseudoalteromonas sp. S2721 TaxID=579526 RepID=UPI00110C065E|nr:DUF4910 domain-containing protein [Pseudoalteromonas sp. S2721]TMP15925.1 aminopeptidase [Pseudoalteromonas sp. S2721]
MSNFKELDGEALHQIAQELFPICRSITGNGVRKTLDIIDNYIEGYSLVRHEVRSGTPVFDWTVPKEWSIEEAWIKDSKGNTVVNFKDSNLHVLGYSTQVDKIIPLNELQKHLHSLPEQPEAIPYVTSYYEPRWGFCITDKQRKSLTEDDYHVFINSNHFDGSLTYAELLIPGKSKKEILISSYVCHPSLANNELSGPLVSLALINWLAKSENNFYSYRFVFTTETIGTITYLSRNLEHLKNNITAGLVLTCIGDDGDYSTVQSRYGDNLSDKVVQKVLSENYKNDAKIYSFLKRGSDERQYCAPNIDLPITSIMRTKYGVYPEYHTSLDDLTFMTPSGLKGGLDFAKKCVQLFEKNHKYITTKLCEPKLSKYNLYPTLSKKGSSNIARNLLNILAYCDGKNDVIDLADILGISTDEVINLIKIASENKLIEAL